MALFKSEAPGDLMLTLLLLAFHDDDAAMLGFAVLSSARMLAVLVLLFGCCPIFVVVRCDLILDVGGMDDSTMWDTGEADDAPARVVSCFEYGMAAEVTDIVVDTSDSYGYLRDACRLLEELVLDDILAVFFVQFFPNSNNLSSVSPSLEVLTPCFFFSGKSSSDAGLLRFSALSLDAE